MDLVSNIKDVFAQWRVGASVFTLIPGRGGRLLSWDIELPKGIRRVLYCPDSEEVNAGIPGCGGSQILFPFVGLSADGKKLDSWKGPKGDTLRMPYNGFAQNGNYKIVSRDETSVCMELVPSVEMDECYPFKYSFTVHYKFCELGIEVTLGLENKDEVTIPWSGGIAFDIAVPWHIGLSQQNYQVRIPAKKVFYQESGGKLVPVKEFEVLTCLDDPSFINRIHTKLRSNSITLGPKGDEEDITISIGRDIIPLSFASVKIWKDAIYSVCRVEVSMGLPNAQENRKGFCAVLPADKESFTVFLNLL